MALMNPFALSKFICPLLFSRNFFHSKLASFIFSKLCPHFSLGLFHRQNAFFIPHSYLRFLVVCLSAFCFFANVTSLASLRSLQFIHSFLHIEWSTQQKSSFLSISSFSFTFPSQTLPRLNFSHLKNNVLVNFTNCEVPCSSG